MSSLFDELLEETDDRVRAFLAEHAFTDAFHLLSCDADPNAPLPAPWANAAIPAPVGMRHVVNVDDTTVQRTATRATCHLVVSTLDDALKATAADVSNIYKCIETELMGADVVVDAQVLEIVQPRTKERPHDCVSLKHVKYRSVLEEYQAEDFLLLEATGKGAVPPALTGGTSGYQYAFKMVRSVDIPGADELLASDDVRLELHRGWIHHLVVLFSETKLPGILRMDVWLDADVTQSRDSFHGGFSGLHDAFSLAIRYRHLVENHQSTKIGTKPGTNCTTSVPAGVPATAILHFPATVVATAQARDRVCQMCTKRVGFFSRKRKHVCAVCGIFLCSPCVTPTEFNAWKLCAVCCDRNDALIARHTVSRLAASSFAKLSYLAKVKMGLDRHRQSLYGGERSTMLNRRATVTSVRKHSGATRMSLIHKTSGKSAYDVIAEGSSSAMGGDDGGRGSLFDTFNRPGPSLSTPRKDSYGARFPSSSTPSGSGYSTTSSTSSYGRKASDSAPLPLATAVSSSSDSGAAPMKAASMSANDYYLTNITRSYSIAKSRIQLLNDDQQSRLSARTTWRSSAQSDYNEIHSIPEADSSNGRHGGARSGYYDAPAY